ncbi:helix-turn-helix domain-containing protein [Halorussus aquaticus]|uniref:Helix-turn-helix domain-containing protein n=1 Tax=Halorussus aquaticus TaxID=2953748 RepID=A0ABD5Q545_9EURY|nr:helix-turn-helix domain-containing protein [Halorussus aquaticus]
MTTRPSETDVSEFDVGTDRRDELFDVLSHPHRRLMLHVLETAEVLTAVGALTTEIVAWETRQRVSDRSGADRDAIELSLVHNHLPKMAEAGLVDCDAAGRTVTLAERTDEVRAHLRTSGPTDTGGD